MITTQALPSTMGRVALSVADLDRSLNYYQHGIGLRLNRRKGDVAYLGVGGEDMLILQEKRGARLVRRAAGLYHFALLVPSRSELARTIQHLQASNTPIGGASDHAVSEALYLSDPDGHGIEIYRDRPRSDWQFPQNILNMTIDPFDIAGVMGTLTEPETTWAGLHPDTIMGHVHLQVSTIPATEQFYMGLLGFDLMVRYNNQATFLAYDGYHHHLGANTWAGVGAPPRSAEALGLEWYEIRLRETAVYEQIQRRLQEADYSHTLTAAGIRTEDPSGNQILVTLSSNGTI